MTDFTAERSEESKKVMSSANIREQEKKRANVYCWLCVWEEKFSLVNINSNFPILFIYLFLFFML